MTWINTLFNRKPSRPASRILAALALAVAATAIARLGLADMPAAGLVPPSATKPPATAPVVVELFTSQGCSSCPPADRLMNELSKRDDLITLSYPIDYWDRLGWPDTFADPKNTARQQIYANQFHTNKYTPQMVINGTRHLAGNKRSAVLKQIENQSKTNPPRIPMSASWTGTDILLEVDKSPAWNGISAKIVMAPYFSKDRTVHIKGGENSGETISYSHIVSGLTNVGSYDGNGQSIPIPAEALLQSGADACAFLLQNTDTGVILGATTVTDIPAADTQQE